MGVLAELSLILWVSSDAASTVRTLDFGRRRTSHSISLPVGVDWLCFLRSLAQGGYEALAARFEG